MIETRLYVQFKGLAVDPKDISLSGGNGLSIPVLRRGVLLQADFKRWKAQIKIRGASYSQALTFYQQAQRSPLDLYRGNVQTEDITFGSLILREAVLLEAQGSEPIQVGDAVLVEDLTLTYESLQFT